MIIGFAVAMPSGAAVALSVLANNSSSLVGVAISASLLPPAVNCGILWGFAAVVSAKPSDHLDGEEKGKRRGQRTLNLSDSIRFQRTSSR